MILTFHKVSFETPTVWWISNDKFASLLDELADKKFTNLDNYDPRDSEQVVITFDGPYECILSYAVPELNRRKIPFDVYVIGDYIGRNNEFDSVEPLTNFCSQDQLEEIKANGGNLQWHTRTHQMSLTPSVEEIEDELTIPEHLLQQFPEDFRHFAYPHGKVTQQFKEIVSRRFSSAQGVDTGSTFDQFEMERITVFQNTHFSTTTVSLMLMNYNYAPYLIESYESVRRQTTQPNKFRLVDDCSTDGSVELIKRSIDSAEIILNSANLGIVDNFNAAMDGVDTDYAMFLGADNYLHPSAIQKLKYALDTNPDASIAYFDMVIVGPLALEFSVSVNAKKVGRSLRDNSDVFLYEFPDFDKKQLARMETSNIINGSAMFRVSAFREVGGYQKVYPEDHNLWKRILGMGHSAVRVNKPLLYYRQHSPSQANTALAKELELKFLRNKVDFFYGLTAALGSDEDQRALREAIRGLPRHLMIVFGNPKLLLVVVMHFVLNRAPDPFRKIIYKIKLLSEKY
jgi:glycosyltransferase involved in cell wall biosynthesis